MAFRNAVLLFAFFYNGLHSLYIQCAFCLWDTDGIAAACYCTVDILFPVWGIKTIDADYSLAASVIDLF